ncbi:MAG: NAD(P)/FAD-dependent oxidoreductase [Methanosarcinales archaeon]|nr:MAG: NAD(P)/FAD-dependent oxidoreductase [Methanosarcinales archaeon]
MDEVKITIIGAGVVGLAIAAELSQEYDDIVVLERHDKFGQGTSSRNSEVIHSGIYYPPKSLKSGLCVEGAELLYEYCEKYSIPYSKLGKLIVASNESEIIDLQKLYDTGSENGVKGLTLIEKNEINRMEPNVNAIAALYSPNTGIIDSHSLMSHLHRFANASGVLFSFNTEVNFIEKQQNAYVVGIKNDDYKFLSSVVINSAGLSADYMAELAGIDIDEVDYRLEYCKGSYFSYAKRPPIKMLVYPVPHKDLTGLGIHATLDLGGRLRFGPDSEYVDFIDYKVDSNKIGIFYDSVKKNIKGLDKEAFGPEMSGIRPKLSGKNEKARDFVIKDETEKGLEGLINLIGIESPGLTASPAIARMVADMVSRILN